MNSKDLFNMYDTVINMISNDEFLSLSDLSQETKIKKDTLYDLVFHNELTLLNETPIIEFDGNYYFNRQHYNDLLYQIKRKELMKSNNHKVIVEEDFKYTAKDIGKEVGLLPQTIGILVKKLHICIEDEHYIYKTVKSKNGKIYGKIFYTDEVLNKIKEITDEYSFIKLLAYERSINKYINTKDQINNMMESYEYDLKIATALIQRSKEHDEDFEIKS